LPQSTVLYGKIWLNISTVHLGILRTIQDCKWIDIMSDR
jgi:hypothetical protein